jgi:hypothetical protein
MSARASTSRGLRICSGAMNKREPRMVPVAVMWLPSSSAVGRTFATPKSSTFTSGFPSALRLSSRLLGLRSRWTMPRAWASARATHA